MSECEKPDGWVCQDPNGWYHWDNVSLDSDYEVFSKVVNEGPYGENFESLNDYEAAVDDAKQKGWKARPFKFLDEVEK